MDVKKLIDVIFWVKNKNNFAARWNVSPILSKAECINIKEVMYKNMFNWCTLMLTTPCNIIIMHSISVYMTYMKIFWFVFLHLTHHFSFWTSNDTQIFCSIKLSYHQLSTHQFFAKVFIIIWKQLKRYETLSNIFVKC